MRCVVVLLASAMYLSLFAGVASAADRVWDGGGAANQNFSEPTNWDGDIALSDGDHATISGAFTAVADMPALSLADLDVGGGAVLSVAETMSAVAVTADGGTINMQSAFKTLTASSGITVGPTTGSKLHITLGTVQATLGSSVSVSAGSNVELAGGTLSMSSLTAADAAALTVTGGRFGGTLNFSAPVVDYSMAPSEVIGFGLGTNADVRLTGSGTIVQFDNINVGDNTLTVQDVSINYMGVFHNLNVTSGGELDVVCNVGPCAISSTINSSGMVSVSGAGSTGFTGGGLLTGNVAVTGAGDATFGAAMSVDHLTVGAGGLTARDTGAGSLRASSSQIIDLAGETLRLEGTLVLEGASALVGAGAVEPASGASSATVQLDGGGLGDAGALTLAAGLLTSVTDDTDLGGTRTITNEGTLRFDAPATINGAAVGNMMTNAAGGLISRADGVIGTTRLTFPAGLVNGGSVATGDETINVTGSFLQSSTGSVTGVVSGAAPGQYGQLDVVGNVTLAGSLILAPTVPFAAAAAAGSAVVPLAFTGTRSGIFTSSTTSPTLSAGRLFAFSYDDIGGRVVATVPQDVRPPTGATSGADVLTGTAGADLIDGLAGDDTLYGLAGGDTLMGGAGRDDLFGGRGADKLFGGAGADHLIGGSGRDVLHGDRGNDHIRSSNDGTRDTIVCGAGKDTVVAGRTDRVSRDCERVTRRRR